MNKAYLAVGIILLSIVAFAAINLIQNYSTGNELDYYLLKETAQASMSDAVDKAYWRQNSTLRIDKEKFVESFILRFGNAVDDSRDYDIKIYDINEVPPKVSIKVDSANVSFNPNGDGNNGVITTQIDAILVSNNKSDPIAVKYKNEK